MSNHLNDYFVERRRHLIQQYRQLNEVAKKGQAVFAGSSLMERFPILELKQNAGLDKVIYNRGIGGYTTDDLIEHLDTCILDLEPSELFMNIGSNDMGVTGFTVAALREKLCIILERVKKELPDCKIYLLGYYPVNDKDSFPPSVETISFEHRNNEIVQAANEMVKKLASEYDCEYLDLNAPLYDEKECLKKEYSVEGLHMWPNAYVEIFKELLPYL